MADGYGYIFLAAIYIIVLPVLIISIGGTFAADTDIDTPPTYDEWMDTRIDSITDGIGSWPVVGVVFDVILTGTIGAADVMFGFVLEPIYEAVSQFYYYGDVIEDGFGLPGWVANLAITIWLLIPGVFLIVKIIIPLIEAAIPG